MTLSKRHHYLPEFYIKGFVGDDGKVAVFNKVNGKSIINRQSPKQVFYEWNRNTFEIRGKNTDFVEKLHSFGDNQFAPTYKKLTERLEEIELSAYDIFHLMLFISTTHRRIPHQDEDITEYIDNLRQENSIFGIRDRKTGKDASKELFDRIINEPAFKESSKIIRSMEDYFKVDKVKDAKNWKLSYVPQQSPQLHLLSDNPLILKDTKTKEILNSILIFPLSKGISVYNIKNKTLKEIPAEHTIKVDILIFIQGEKMVCGPDSNYLKSISELAENYNTERRIEILKEQIFKDFT